MKLYIWFCCHLFAIVVSFIFQLCFSHRHRGQGCSRNTKRFKERRQLILIFNWSVTILTFLSGQLLSRYACYDYLRRLYKIFYQFVMTMTFGSDLFLFTIRDPQRLLMKGVSSSLHFLFQSSILYNRLKSGFWLKYFTQMCILR